MLWSEVMYYVQGVFLLVSYRKYGTGPTQKGKFTEDSIIPTKKVKVRVIACPTSSFFLITAKSGGATDSDLDFHFLSRDFSHLCWA